MAPTSVIDFKTVLAKEQWIVVDDAVMGGRSSGSFLINQYGHGIFSGEVSLENNGGFTSVKCSITYNTSGHQQFLIRLKGDGKQYQFRIKENTNDRHSYVAHFNTNGQLQIIDILFNQLKPQFRGQQVNLPNFAGGYIEEICFLIANKNAEHFELLIDYIAIS